MSWKFITQFSKVPVCCKNCIDLELYTPEDDYSTEDSAYFCIKGLFLPTKKNTCKRKRQGINDD